jgi:MFS transporter, OFA family, oxalate/formate antiporter
MTRRDRQGWLIAGTLFVSLFFLWGSGYDTFPVFFPALLRHFGWSREHLAMVSAALALAIGVTGPVAGWLLDRIEARWVMAAGAALTVTGFVLASRSSSFAQLLAANVILGVGLGAGSVLPAALVIANWFGERRRGLVMGLATTGMEVGGMVMAIVAGHVISTYGWRAAYLTLAAPALVLVVPLLLIFVQTRPEGTSPQSVAESSAALPGLEVGESVRTRAFWILCLIAICYGFAVAGTFVHIAEYVIGAGYFRETATLVVGANLGLAALGKPLLGALGDRIGAKNALGIGFVLLALSTIILLGIPGHGWLLAIQVLLAGTTGAAPIALGPMLQAETLGLKRFGSLAGLVGLFTTIGLAVGPVAVGRMADVSGSYAGAFELCTAVYAVAAVASFACVTPEASWTESQGFTSGKSASL